MTFHYQVGDHIFAIEATEEQFAQLPNYAPFRISTDASPLFVIHVEDGDIPSSDNWEHVYTDRSDEALPHSITARLQMFPQLVLTSHQAFFTREAMQAIAVQTMENARNFLEGNIDNAAMLVYAFATVGHKTLLFHSSVTVRDGLAYMFLGHSGTGKSTHSQQWKAAFPEVELLNDDNPAVRIMDDRTVRVYGTPWSGKTPCYKASSAPVAALVQLAQAPQNIITRLRMSQAYPFILASVSGLKVLPKMMDQIYESIALLLELCPVYKLECLPNPDAARVCYEEINRE